MTNAALYFELARSAEKAGNECAALPSTAILPLSMSPLPAAPILSEERR